MNQTSYYDSISNAYNELYSEEQLKKCRVIAENFDFRNKKILDVGCGTGIATEFFHCDTGVEPSKRLLEIASEKYPSIQFIKASAESLPFNDDEFDAVVSLTAVQNFDDIEKGLMEIKRVAKEFVLTFMKRSEKRKKIEGLVKKLFKIKKIIEEEKDLIYLCSK